MLGTHCMIMVLCSSVCYRMDKHLWVMLSDTISAFWPAHLGWKKYCKYNILKVLYCRYYMLTWVGGKREAWCWPVTGITNTGHQQSHCAWNSTNKQKRIWCWKSSTGCWHLIIFIEDLPNIPHICHGRHRRRPCKFFLPGVNFYRFIAKNWQFTVYFVVIYAFFRCKFYSPKILIV